MPITSAGLPSPIDSTVNRYGTNLAPLHSFWKENIWLTPYHQFKLYFKKIKKIRGVLAKLEGLPHTIFL